MSNTENKTEETTLSGLPIKREKRGRGRPTSLSKIKNNAIIDPVLNETLFRLWMDGKNLTEIVRMYANTSNRFSLQVLSTTAERFKWIERRAELLDHIIKVNNEQILIDKRKQIEAVSRMIDMNLHIIEDAYKDYIKNPKKFFEDQERLKGLYWLVGDINKLKELFEFYEKVITESKPKQVEEKSQDSPAITNLIIQSAPKEIRQKFYSLLKETADSVHTGQFDTAQKMITNGNTSTSK
jgi:hypothetical protein